MTIWIVLAAMTGAAVMSVLWPLSRRALALSPLASETAFYRDQLGDIARDQGRGLLAPDEAEAARAEAGRRLIRSEAAHPGPAPSTGEPALRRRRAAAAIGLSVVPLVALAVYGVLGSPDRPALPAAARSATQGGALDLEASLARIEQHLALHPEDVRGWDLIAPIYLRIARFPDAEKAYAAAIRLGGADLVRLTGRGEALFGAAEGVMTAEAREVFERAAAIKADDPKAHFYLGVAAEQDGDTAGAARHFETILAGSPADAPWLALVRGKLAALSAPAGGAPPSALADKAVPPEIRAMVEGLDSRLATGGGSPEEWERLIRSYGVLGERDKAEAALIRARKALGGSEAGSGLQAAALAAGLDAGRASP